jgi:hypothetical protein
MIVRTVGAVHDRTGHENSLDCVLMERAYRRGIYSLILLVLFITPSLLSAQQITFTDITSSAGIDFTHNNGATGNKYLPETVGAGVAFIDYNQDRFPDIFFANGTNWPGDDGPRTTLKLYRNNGNQTFTDVTSDAGLGFEMYAMGASVADYDNDGDDDLYVTALGQNRLFRNNGDGTFSDRTEHAGMLGPEEFSTSASWADYDNDGDVDLFEANYVQWSIETDLRCELVGTDKSYCTPQSYEGASLRLWDNLGDGTFEDRTESAGIFDPTSKGLGIATFDPNRDGLTDVLVVNDTEPNRLYENNGDGTFFDVGLLAGIAYSEDGVARAGMGVDVADYDRSGAPSILIGNFSNEMLGLYHNEGSGLFIDDAPRSEVGRRSLLTLAFACLFFDYDLDGWLDIFVNNGHVDEGFEQLTNRITYAEPPHVFRNLKGEGFEEVTSTLGEEFASTRIGRGAALGDIDLDGDLDILITTSGGPAVLFRNDGGNREALRVRLLGTAANRNGLGARVTVTAGEDIQTQTMRSGTGYLSQNEMVLTFGLDRHTEVDRVEVEWPGGHVDRLDNLEAGHLITIEEGVEIVVEKFSFQER